VHEWVRDDEGKKNGLRIDHYFDSGPYVIDWNMARLTTHWATPQWHRTLTEWSALIAEAGFVVTHPDEPRPTPEQAASNPKMIPAMRIPYFLVLALRSIP
jgi:hypothetical protein